MPPPPPPPDHTPTPPPLPPPTHPHLPRLMELNLPNPPLPHNVSIAKSSVMLFFIHHMLKARLLLMPCAN